MHEFDPPEQPLSIAWPSLRWLGWFAVGRILRVLASGLVLVVCVRLIWPTLSTLELAATLLVGVLLWMPTTWTLLRVRLLPGPVDPRLTDDDGRPLCPDDLLAEVRAWHAEYLLGTLPALMLSVWLVLSDFGGIGWAVGGVLALWTLGRVLPAVPGWTLSIAHVLLPLDRATEAREGLERWTRWPWLLGARRDEWLHLLARARFRSGDVDGALEALERIGRPKSWHVADLRAAMAVARAPEAAADRAAALAEDDDERGRAAVLRALAALHRAPPEAVDPDALLALVDDEPTFLARQLRLLAAAAVAAADPPRAAELLEEARFEPTALDDLAAGWPGVVRPLERLYPNRIQK